MDAYGQVRLLGEELWTKFISVFRSHSIKMWNHIVLSRWTKFLRKTDVYLEVGRGANRAQNLINLLYRERHICLKDSAAQLHDVQDMHRSLQATRSDDVPRRVNDEPRKLDYDKDARRGAFTHPERKKLTRQANSDNREYGDEENEGEKPRIPRNEGKLYDYNSRRGGGPPGDDDDDGDGD